MQAIRHRRVVPLVTLVLGVAVAAAGLFAWSQSTAGAPPQRERVVKDAGAWKLLVTTDEAIDEKGRPIRSGAVLYNTAEASSIVAYGNAVKAFGPSAFADQKTVPVLVTFDRPVSFERFTSMMQGAPAGVKSFRIRTGGPDGTKGTIGGSPEPDGTLVSAQHVQGFLERQRNKSGQVATIAGIIDAEVTVDVTGYTALSSQPEVYLVDTMRGIAARELAGAGIGGYGLADIRLRGPYAYLEELGLIGR